MDIYGRALLQKVAGVNGTKFAQEVGISLIYWNELRTGVKNNPSERVIESMAKVCCMPIDIVMCLFFNKDIDKELITKILCQGLKEYLE